jgi:hypothetical protein
LRFEREFDDRLHGIRELVAARTVRVPARSSRQARTRDFFFGFDCDTHFKKILPDETKGWLRPRQESQIKPKMNLRRQRNPDQQTVASTSKSIAENATEATQRRKVAKAQRFEPCEFIPCPVNCYPACAVRFLVPCVFAPLQCYLPTSSRPAKIFSERGPLSPRVPNAAPATRGLGGPRSFDCGFAALRLCVKHPFPLSAQ